MSNISITNNRDFRTITADEFIEEGTLVWVERNILRTGELQVTGPFVIESGWGPIYFGSPNQNKPNSKNKVKLLNTITGDVEFVSWRSFLFTTYYVMNEERLCTDVEIK